MPLPHINIVFRDARDLTLPSYAAPFTEDMQVGFIKQRLEKEFGIPRHQMKIAYKGRIMHPDEQTLGFYNVQSGDQMYVWNTVNDPEFIGPTSTNESAPLEAPPKVQHAFTEEKIQERIRENIKESIRTIFRRPQIWSFKEIDQIIYKDSGRYVPPKFIVDYLIQLGYLEHVKQKNGIRYLRDRWRGGIESHFPDPAMPEDRGVEWERMQAPLFDNGPDAPNRPHRVFRDVIPRGKRWMNRALNMYDRWVDPRQIIFILHSRFNINTDDVTIVDVLLLLLGYKRVRISHEAAAANGNGWAVKLESLVEGLRGWTHPPIIIESALKRKFQEGRRRITAAREAALAARGRRLARTRQPRTSREWEIQALYGDGVPITRIPERVAGGSTLQEVIDVLVGLELIKITRIGYPTRTSIRFVTFFDNTREVTLDLANPTQPAKTVPAGPHPLIGRRSPSEERLVQQLTLQQRQGLVLEGHTPAGLLRMQARGQNIYTPAGQALIRENRYPTLPAVPDGPDTRSSHRQIEVGRQGQGEESLDEMELDEMEEDEMEEDEMEEDEMEESDEEMGEAELHHEMDLEDEYLEENPGEGNWLGRGRRR